MYKSIIETHHKIKLEEESHTYTLSNSNVEFAIENKKIEIWKD